MKRSPLLIIFVTVFIDLLGFGIVMPLLPRYGEHFGMGKISLGLLMASFSAMQFVFSPLWGRISDRIGRRPVLLLGLAGSALFYGLFGFATSLGNEGVWLGLSAVPWLFITRIGAGIAGATISTAQAYIADSTTAEGRGKGMALIGAAFGIGFTFGPLVGALCVSSDLNGPPSALAGYVASGMSACAFLFALARLPESLTHGVTSTVRRQMNFGAIARAFSRAGIGLLLATIFLTTFAFAQFEVTLSLFTKHLGLADKYMFFVYAYVGFILALSQGFLVRRLAPKLGEFKMSLIGTVLMTIGLVLIAVVSKEQSLGMLYSILPICVVGYSALTPSLQALLSLRCGAEEQGEMLGVGQSMSALARILGPVVGVTLFKLGQEQPELGVALPYWMGAGLMLVGVGMVVALRFEQAKATVKP
ncbi:MAG: MFS transporter [Planctomycetia bacterium]|nr:MFS transporter [Planctomycetia bacterium]